MISIIHTWRKPHKFTSSTQYIVHIDGDGREQKKILQAGKMSKSRDMIFPLLHPRYILLKISLQWIGDKFHFKIQSESNTSKSDTEIVEFDRCWMRALSIICQQNIKPIPSKFCTQTSMPQLIQFSHVKGERGGI
mgnify:CR=1 FL=1